MGTMEEPADVLTIEEAADPLRVSSKGVLALTRDSTRPEAQVGPPWRLLRAGLLKCVCAGHGRRPGCVA